jgi:hypothetical protein
MKFISQMGLAVAAIVVLVAGVTYMSLYSSGSRGANNTPVAAPLPRGEKTELYFPGRNVKTPLEYASDFEVLTTGTYDVWFQNKSSIPITLGVDSKSCKCSELFISVLSREDTEQFPPQAAASAVAEVGAASLGAPGLLAMFGDTDQSAGWLAAGAAAPAAKLKWQPFEVNKTTGVSVAPQCGGLFRVSFKGEKASAARLSIGLWSEAETASPSPRADYKLEIPARFVPVLQVAQPEVKVEELNYGEQKTVEFLCWSSTRAKFSLKAKENSGDACFTCACTPLSDEECRQAAPKVASRVLAGYNVKVTVRERVPEGSQLDWGPFLRRIVLTSDPDIEPTDVELRGRVIGEIIIGIDEDKGAIVLGEFSAKNGKTKTIRLTPLQAGADLQFERVEPPTLDYIKLKSLTKIPAKIGRPEWDLSVEAKPGCPPGPLPRHSAIILKVAGTNPHNVRIPVRGLAYQ